MKGAYHSPLGKALASSTALIPTDHACSGGALAGIALSAALAGWLGLPLPHAWAQTFGGAGGTGSNGPGGAGGGLDRPGGSAPAGSNGGGGGGGPGLANAASGAMSGTGQPGGAGNGTGGAGGAGGANGYDATAGAFDSTANYTGAGGVAGGGTASSAGGGGGGAGGFGAVLQGSGSFGTTGQLSGGNGGDGGSSGVPGMATVAGSGAAGNGGAGAYLSGPLTFTVNPAGGAGGGAGGYGGSEYGAGVAGKSGNGGTGIYVTGGATLINQGAIGGGEGRSENFATAVPGAGGSGGDGVYIAGGTLINAANAMIGGGDGGTGGAQSGPVATGGNGVTVATASQVINSGMISGGRGASGNDLGGNGGDGGIGASFLASGGVLINAGAIAGGEGGSAGTGAALAGAGGIGIIGSDLKINNAGGTIAGGASGDATTQAYAIQFTAGANYVGAGGTITGGINVMSGASFQPALPGAAVGTPLAITGPLVFARTATYQIRIDGAANDSVVASNAQGLTGSATLNGAKVFVQAAAAAPVRGMRYTIVTADGGVNGQFRPNVGSSLAFFAPTLAYDATHVYLDASYDFARPAFTVNEQRVGQALNIASNGAQSAAGARLLNGLELVSKGQGPAVLDSLSGEGITATQNLANRSAQMFNDAIFDQTTFYGNGGAGNQIVLTDAPPAFTAYAPLSGERAPLYGPPVRELADLPAAHIAPTFVAPTRTWRAWASGFGGTEDIHGNGAIGSAAQDNTIYGGALGVDYQLMPNYLFGVAVGGSDGDFQVPGRTTYGSTTGGHIAIYDLATFGSFYGASSSSFSYFTNRTTRFIGGFGGLGSETERGDFDSHEYRTRLEFGRHVDGLFGFGGTLTPFIALEIAELRSNGFGETSVSGPGLFRLNVSGQSAADVPGYLGLRYQTIMPLGGMAFLPSLQVAYVHEFAPYRSQIGALADLPGSTFLVDGARPARDAAQVKAGGELKIGPNSALFANFDGEFSGVNQLYAGKGGIKYVW